MTPPRRGTDVSVVVDDDDDIMGCSDDDDDVKLAPIVFQPE